jgi:hypothetical protein
MTFQRGVDFFEDAVDIPHHVVVPKAQDEIAHRLQNFRSLRVTSCAHSMLAAIEFDDEMSVGAKEIDDKAVDGELSSEFPSTKAAITQTKP